MSAIVIHVKGTTPEEYVDSFNTQVEALGDAEYIDRETLGPLEALVYFDLKSEKPPEHIGRKCCECTRYIWGVGCGADPDNPVLKRHMDEACPSFSTNTKYLKEELTHEAEIN